MPIDLKSEFAEISSRYKAETLATKNNILVVGPMGTGKTHLLGTAPAPILIHSFDPGGTTTLRKEIEAGKVFVERFESEDEHKPSIFQSWTNSFNLRHQKGVFGQIGTYCIDSATFWCDAMVNDYLRQKGRANTPLQLQDYPVLMLTLVNTLKIFASLPCYCILTAHLEIEKDETTGRILTFPVLIGKKLRSKVPAMFDEVYVSTVKPSANGVQYNLLTKPDGLYQARSRIGSGKFDLYEKPDIKYLLTKAGLDASDKVV